VARLPQHADLSDGIGAAMRVRIYWGNALGVFDPTPETECDIAECFPDDAEALATAIANIERNGSHIGGGGAAQAYMLVLATADSPARG
jgi:hypothetical protein